jgi:peptidyl-Lys metalloendopeptidase
VRYLSCSAESGNVAAQNHLVGASRIYDVDNLRVTATLTNSGDETVKVLKDPHSILSEHPANKFSVFNAEGSQPSFGGIKVKYVPEVAAKAGGYVSLSPGQSVTATHDCERKIQGLKPS